MVTIPPQLNGPILGLPCSSSARFQPVIERHPLRRMPMKVLLQVAQSFMYFGSVYSGPPSVQYISTSGYACCTLIIHSGLPTYPCHATAFVYFRTSGVSNSPTARPQRL